MARRSAAHIPALDGVRGIAVLMVLAHNFNLVEGSHAFVARAVGVVLNSGWLGVQLFFVLSGFLITGILIDTREAPNYWRAFLARRALRIFPLYYAVLIAAFVVAPLVAHAPAGSEHQIWLWTYLSNFGPAVSVFPHLWSLSIEEQFYLVWPLFVLILPRRGLATFCGLLVVVAVVSRVLLRASSFGPDAAYTFTNARVDALALGAAGAVAVRNDQLRAWLAGHRPLLRSGSIALALVTVLATRGAPRTGVYTQTYGYTVFALVFTCLVLDAALAPAGDWVERIMSWGPLRAVGRYSYAMYVFHMPIHLLIGMPLLARYAGLPIGEGTSSYPLAIGYFVVATAFTYAAAFASYHLLEKHFLALKRRVEPRVAAS